MWESEGVRVGGEEGLKKDGSTPGMCPRFSSSACVCVYVCSALWILVYYIMYNIIHGHALDNNLRGIWSCDVDRGSNQ